jgi:hypothetical protein
MGNPYKSLVRKPEGKRLLGSPRHSQKNNGKVEIGGKFWTGYI